MFSFKRWFNWNPQKEDNVGKKGIWWRHINKKTFCCCNRFLSRTVNKMESSSHFEWVDDGLGDTSGGRAGHEALKHSQLALRVASDVLLELFVSGESAQQTIMIKETLQQEKLVENYLRADSGAIFMTLIPLPRHKLLTPPSWSMWRVQAASDPNLFNPCTCWKDYFI